MRTITTEITIAAPPDRVWAILTGFAAYPAWNPFVTTVEGTPAVGERLRVRLSPPGGRSMGFRPVVTAVEEGRFLQWLGSVGFRGVFDGRHSFRLSPTEHGTRFEQTERFTGVLSRAMGGCMRARTEAGFRAMNEALRARAEA